MNRLSKSLSQSLIPGLALFTFASAVGVQADELSNKMVTNLSTGVAATDQGMGVLLGIKTYGRSGGFLNVITGKNWNDKDQFLRLQVGGEVGLMPRKYYRYGNFQQDVFKVDGQFTFKNLNACKSDGSNINDCVGTNGNMKIPQIDIINGLSGNGNVLHTNPTMNALHPFAGNGHFLLGLFPSSYATGGSWTTKNDVKVSGYARVGLTLASFGASMDGDAYALNFGQELSARLGGQIRKGKNAFVAELSGSYFHDDMGYFPNPFNQQAVIPSASGLGSVGISTASANVGIVDGHHHGDFNAFVGYQRTTSTGEVRAGATAQGSFWNVIASDVSGVSARDVYSGNSYLYGLQVIYTPHSTARNAKHEYANEVRQIADWQLKANAKAAADAAK